MFKIKTTALFFMSAIAAIGLMAGCTTSTQITTAPDGTSVTNTVNKPDVARISAVAEEAASIGTTEVLASHPEWAPQFQIAAEQLAVLATSPSIGVQDILNIAQQLPVKELKSQAARLSYEGATVLIAAIGEPEVPADKLATLQPIAKAISDGIMRGIQNAPTPAPPAPPAAKPAPPVAAPVSAPSAPAVSSSPPGN